MVYLNRRGYHNDVFQQKKQSLLLNLYHERIIDMPRISQPRNIDGMTKCTLLMPTYRRVEMLPLVVNHYCNMPTLLCKIVLVWNDVDSPIPPSVSELGEKCNTDFKIIPMKENKLSNRFLPRNKGEIETECECRPAFPNSLKAKKLYRCLYPG